MQLEQAERGIPAPTSCAALAAAWPVPQLNDPDAELTPDVIIDVLREVAGHYFPLLAPAGTAAGHSANA